MEKIFHESAIPTDVINDSPNGPVLQESLGNYTKNLLYTIAANASVKFSGIIPTRLRTDKPIKKEGKFALCPMISERVRIQCHKRPMGDCEIYTCLDLCQ